MTAHVLSPVQRFRVPVSLDPDRGDVRWIQADGERFAEPFFEDTVRRLRRQTARATEDATALDAWSSPCESPVEVAIIFHISRCGSTLLSQLLAALPDHLVISEAPVVDDVLRGRWDDPHMAPARRAAWLSHVAAAFARSQASAPSRVVLKLDCWHIFEFDLVRRAFPRAPLLFVYRDPLEVLVSLMARPSLTLVRGTVRPCEIGVSADAYEHLSREELAAATLGSFFREAAAHRAHLVPVAYTSLPQFVWTSFPGLAPTPGDIVRLKGVARAGAKEPRVPFTADGARKRQAAGESLRAACAKWVQPAYDAWLAVV